MSTPRQAHGTVLARGAARPATAVLVALAALLMFGVGTASADPWATIGARATPYSGGSTQGWGVPLLYGDDHACKPDEFETSAYRTLSLKAEVAFGDGKGGWNVSEEVFSPTGPGPRGAAGIAFLSSSTFRPKNGRIKFAVFVSARDNLAGYADNAGRVSGLCILSNIKKEALEESVKAVAKDLVTSQIPLINQVPTDACSLAMTSFTGWMKIEAVGFNALANDPPRPSFRQRVKAVVRVPMSIEATGTGVQAPVASAMNVLIDAHAQADANLDALLVAAERALGAQKAKNKRWQTRHTQDARRFARAAAVHLGRMHTGLPALAAALRSVGYLDSAPTPEQLAGLPAGLTPSTQATVRLLGLGSKDLAELAKRSAAATPVVRSLPAIVEDPTVLAALDTAAAELRSIGAKK